MGIVGCTCARKRGAPLQWTPHPIRAQDAGLGGHLNSGVSKSPVAFRGSVGACEPPHVSPRPPSSPPDPPHVIFPARRSWVPLACWIFAFAERLLQSSPFPNLFSPPFCRETKWGTNLGGGGCGVCRRPMLRRINPCLPKEFLLA